MFERNAMPYGWLVLDDIIMCRICVVPAVTETESALMEFTMALSRERDAF